MNNKSISLLKNFSYALSSNIIALVISTLIILILPRYLGVNEYGYLQLYIFYSSYVGFLHFGWNDGIYLRYGGEEYNNLNKKLFQSQFYMLAILQLIFFLIFTFLIVMFSKEENSMYVLKMTTLCMLIVNIRFMLLFILQATNEVKEYAKVTILDRVSYVALIIGFLLFSQIDFKLIIIFDLIGKGISLIYAMYLCKDIVFQKITSFNFTFDEAIENIRVGIKLMFSNIASSLVIGVVRFGIERSWNVAVFGKVSLTLSISGLMMIFINTMGMIIYPILRRSPRESLPSLYVTLRDILMVILLAFLILYYPLKELLVIWLPHYEDALLFMSLLFPMIVYEGKMALLINTYLKTLRKEELMLKVNIIVLIISIIITLATAVVIKNLDLVILSITILLAFRSLLFEILVSNILEIKILKNAFIEISLTALFISTAWFINSWIIVVIYTIGYLLYLILKYKDIKSAILNLKILVSKN